jgi:predicted esterase
VHGFGGNQKAVYYYQRSNIIGSHIFSFDFPDVTQSGFSILPFITVNVPVDPQYVSLGQETDIRALKEAYSQALDKINHASANINSGIILLGVSRGASTAINFLATHQTPHIKAAIIECPYDAIDQIIHYQLNTISLHKTPGLNQGLHKLTQKIVFPNYNTRGIQPIHVVDKIPHKIPVIFIHSLADKLIWINSSRALYCKLKQAGHAHVYLVELPTGGHADCLRGIEGRYYRAAIHAFYKKYNLPYDPQYIAKGNAILARSQPTVEQVLQSIKSHT